jgi:hypothetical protein
MRPSCAVMQSRLLKKLRWSWLSAVWKGLGSCLVGVWRVVKGLTPGCWALRSALELAGVRQRSARPLGLSVEIG